MTVEGVCGAVESRPKTVKRPCWDPETGQGQERVNVCVSTNPTLPESESRPKTVDTPGPTTHKESSDKFRHKFRQKEGEGGGE